MTKKSAGQAASANHINQASKRPKSTHRMKTNGLLTKAAPKRRHKISDSRIPREVHSNPAIARDSREGSENHSSVAIPEIKEKRGSHKAHGIHQKATAAGDDRFRTERRICDVIPTIQELWKNRQSWHRAEKSLTLQGKAQCRRFCGGDKTEANKLFASIEKFAEGKNQVVSGIHKLSVFSPAILPFLEARSHLVENRSRVEKELIRLAKQLPIHRWGKSIQGFGELSLAAIVGSAGDISSYDTVSKLWKRMGLAVINGERQRRKKDAISAKEHGFSPERGAVMFNISGALIGGMGHGPRPKVGEDVEVRDDLSDYQKRFVALIRKEVERMTDTWNGPDHKRDPVEKNGELYESYSSHAANRIRRRIGKEFLRDLWVAWRACGAKSVEQTNKRLPSKPLILEAAE